jgi:hypothetical protein
MRDLPEYAPDSMKRIMKRTLWSLVIANVCVLSYEVLSLTLLYTNTILARDVVEPVAYAVKLAVEFFVLNSLVHVAKLKGDLLEHGNISAAINLDEAQSASAPRKDKKSESNASPVIMQIPSTTLCMTDENGDMTSTACTCCSSVNNTDRDIEELEREYLGQAEFQ